VGRPGIRLVRKGQPIEVPERLGYEHGSDLGSPMAGRY
jgi:hypothetical protein